MKHTYYALLVGLAMIAGCKKEDEGDDYELVASQSVAEWKGYLKTGYYNEGEIGVKSISLKVHEDRVIGGTFYLPLNTIKNLNLPTEDLKTELVNHLKSADFFDMAKYANLQFKISKIAVYTGGTTGAVDGANYTVSGNLTMVGKTLPISFPAKINVANGQLSLAALLKVDRTKWGMTYATSDTLADDKRIMNDIDIELNLKGQKK
ncbi:YceI family protein [uncultured Chitinophaga sp.]|uniref:YceI family protein n=1 Tax=uncultured Chitinophaga sp. TaxID=339340 RepID=UPI0025D72117|nr:YceI family protein [uncultured Chitinophaga sp.]